MEEKFICSYCKTEWERNTHYKAILRNLNLINLMMGNKETIDYCSKCDKHFNA